jgi:peptidoglycan/LPS O-acetylase OafA/YrhL
VTGAARAQFRVRLRRRGGYHALRFPRQPKIRTSGHVLASSTIRENLPALTGLRGLAALVVVVFHTRRLGGVEFASFAPVIDHSYIAVDVFFVLSGFILTHVYGSRFTAQWSRTDIAEFWWARIARCYPIHLFMLVLFLRNWRLPGNGLPGLLLNLFMLNVWGSAWNPVAWSISAEFHAYALFPFIVGALLRTRFPLFIALGAIAAEICGWDNILGPLAIVRVIAEFVLGILIYRAWHAGHLPTRVASAFGFLEARPCLWLGRVSYSLYMVQVFVILVCRGAFEHVLPSPLLFVTMVALCLGAAAVLSRYVEYPARDYLRRWRSNTASMPAASPYVRERLDNSDVQPVAGIDETRAKEDSAGERLE